jgi:hypothetical protein
MDTTTVRTEAQSMQTYARLAGVLFLISMFAGFFGELYVPNRLIVSGDATSTANNIIASSSLLRLSFAGYLVEAVCDIVLAWIFYVLLRPAHRNLALLSAFFGLVSTATFAGTELFYFAPTFILGGAGYLKTFSPDQLNSLAMLSLRFYGVGAGLFMVFYGTGWLIRGYLISRSGYLPRFLGWILMVAGFGFIIRNFLLVLAPGYASDFLLAPMFVGGLTLMLWLLVKGIDASKWEAKAAASAGSA